jgi:hypothetical protein
MMADDEPRDSEDPRTDPADIPLDEEIDYEAEYDFEDWTDIPDEEAGRVLRGLEALIPDIVKRTMGNVLHEEGLRAFVGEKNIPKEAAGFVLGQVDATRRGILRIVSREIRVFLENMDFGGEIAKILTTLSFEIKTEIRFVPNEERVVPSVKNKVRVKRADGDETGAREEAEASENAAEESLDESSEADEKAAEKKKASRWTRRRKPEGE